MHLEIHMRIALHLKKKSMSINERNARRAKSSPTFTSKFIFQRLVNEGLKGCGHRRVGTTLVILNVRGGQPEASVRITQAL